MASVAAGLTVKAVLLKVGKAVGLYVAGKLLDKATDALSGSTRESVVRRIEGQKVNVRSTQASLPVVYGIQRVGLIVNDVRNASSPSTFFSGATGKDVLVKSGAIAIGSEDGSGIQAVDNIRVYDDGDYAITSPASFPSSAVNTNVALPYTNYLKYIVQDGDDAQTVPSDLGTAMGWSSDYKARGIAYGAFFCLYNENVWKRGVPQITMDVTGNRVYDPRTSSWIGYAASGASSDNPALCILDYLTSKRYGAGIPYATRDGGTLDFIDEQSFEDAADYCDVLVNTYTTGPQEKRFRMNAVVDTSRVVSANLVEMLATCRGELVWQNGKYRLIIRQAQTAQSFELTEDNIVGALDWTRKGTSVPNLIEATFPNESGDDYVADSIQFPPVGTTTYLDEDNGIENRLEIALPYTTSIYQAQRTVETMLKELRSDVYVSLTATQAAYTLQVGDVVNVTHSGPQWSAKGFVVRSVALTADGLVGLGLQEYDATAYTVTTPDQETADDAIDLPDPQRAFITISMAGDRFISQGATTSGGVAAQQWKRRLNFRTGINTRSVNIVYDFDRPDIGDVTSTNFSRNYTVNVTPDSEVAHILEDGASGEQIFLARDDNGNTKYDEAISVTITPNDTTGGGGQDGTVVTTQILDLALEDDLGFRVDAEVEVVEANYAETNGDAWFSFTTSIAYFAQGFTMPAGTDRDLASVEVYLQRVGSPAGDVNLYVYDNNTTPTPDEPNASVAAATTSVDASTLSASGQVVRLDMDRVSLTAGGSYWVVVEHIDSSGTDYVQIRVDESSPNGSDMTDTATSPEIVSWTVTSASTRQAAGFYVRRFGTQVVPTRQLAPAADKSAKFTWQSDGTVALASVTSGGGGGASTLAGLTDTTITTPGIGDFLRYNGSTWLNTTLVAGDIPSLDAAKITTGTFADALIAESNVTQHEAALSVLGIEALSDPNADRIFFWDDVGAGGFEWLSLSSDFVISTTELQLASGAVGLTTAGTGLEESPSGTVKVDYSNSASNLIDGAASGSIAGADDVLFWDVDDSTVKKDTVSNLGSALTITEGQITDGSILARVASDETISGAYTFTDVDGILVNVGAGGLYLQNSAFHAASLMTAGLKYVPGGGADNSPYDRLNWEYTDAAGASNNAGSAIIMRGNGSETGLTFEWYTAPTSTGAGANPASLTKRLDITTAAFEYGTSAQFRVTSAGLITAGEWDATTIAVDHGGTGISGGIAADQFLIGDGTANPYVASGANLVWSGTQLTINDATIAHTGTGGFTGDGSGLNNVSADSSTVSNLTTEVATYYPMLSDGASGSVSHSVNSTDLRWKNTATANQLLLANGAEATPIIGFINDEDTGLYLASTGNLSLATGGSRIANFGTGMTLYGTLNIEQNAVSRFATMTRTDLTDLTWDVRIDAAGDLEIRSTTDTGTTTLNALQMVHATGDLTLKGWVRSEDGAVGAPTYGFSSDTDTGVWLNGTGVLAFAVRGVNRFQIDESGTTTARTQFDATQVYNTEGTEVTRGSAGAVTLDWDAYNQVSLRNDGNIDTINIDDNSMQDGGHYCLIVRAATGVQASITFSASGTFYWQGGAAPTFPLTVGNRTVITFIKTEGITLGYYADATA